MRTETHRSISLGPHRGRRSVVEDSSKRKELTKRCVFLLVVFIPVILTGGVGCGLNQSVEHLSRVDKGYGDNANLPQDHTAEKSMPSAGWLEQEIVSFMDAHPNRAYFSRLFRDGGFRVGMEVGVADGRFSEHFLLDNSSLENWTWYMVEPYPNANLLNRMALSANGSIVPNEGTWAKNEIGQNAHKVFYKVLSTNDKFIADINDKSIDFLYLDGAHDHDTVRAELNLLWPKVREGGVFAGHDYCNHGETGLDCKGCDPIPRCQPYTEYGVQHGKPGGIIAANQNGVVRAVQEWLVEAHPELNLHHTEETFTPASLAIDQMKYSLVITGTRNPSWFVIKTKET